MGNQSWNQSTFIFYISIIAFCFVASILFSNKTFIFERGKYKLNIIVPIFILLFIKGFAYCGTDVLGGYQMNFNSASSMSAFYDKSLELGYRIINVIIKRITNNYSVLIFVIAVFTLFPVMYITKKYKSLVNIPIVIVAYATIFFFPGISLLRIYLAASLSLYSFDAIIEKKYVKAIVWFCIAALFHITAVIMVIPCLFYIFRINKKYFAILLFIGFLVLYAGQGQILALISGNERYYLYAKTQSFHIGTEFIWYYGPLAALYWYVNKLRKRYHVTNDASIRFINISFLWVLLGIFFSLAQYVIEIFGRMYAYSLPIIFFIGYSINFIKRYEDKNYKLIYIITVIYLLLRFCIYINGHYESDGIMPYRNCFGWII